MENQDCLHPIIKISLLDYLSYVRNCFLFVIIKYRMMLFVYKILNSINLIISEKFVNNRVVESETISAGISKNICFLNKWEVFLNFTQHLFIAYASQSIVVHGLQSLENILKLDKYVAHELMKRNISPYLNICNFYSC